MRVVFIRSNPVSPDSRVEKEVYTLLKNGHDVQVLGWDRDSDYSEKKETLTIKDMSCLITKYGIKATFGGGIKKNARPLLLFQLKIRKWLNSHQNEYDIIHACDFDTAYTANKAALKLNKQMVYDIFDYYVDGFTVPQGLKTIIEKADIKTINQASHIIICTEQRSQQISAAKPTDLIVIHNTPYSLPVSDGKFRVNANKLSIAYVGILQNGRMIKELVDSVGANPNLELHIGGFGQLEAYIKEKSQLYSNVFFYGKLPYDKTLQLENSCDILTALYDPSLPNHYYAAPNKFYEALMLGKPLIMAKNTGLDSIISTNNFGRVIDFNETALANALKELSMSKQSFTEIGRKMKLYYTTEFSWEEMESRLLSLYNRMEEEYEKDYGCFWNETRGNKDVSFGKRPSI